MKIRDLFLVVGILAVASPALAAGNRFVTFATNVVRLAHIQDELATERGQNTIVTFRYFRHCDESFAGFVQRAVGPISTSHASIAAGVLLQSNGIACAGADVFEQQNFAVPNVVGGTTVNILE